jgi:hypothetical protein
LPTKEEIAAAKKQLEDLMKFMAALRDAEAENITDSAERRKAQINAELANKKAELKAEEDKIKSNKNLNEAQLKTLETIAKLRVEIEKKAANDIGEIDKETFRNRADLQAAATRATIELQADSLEKELQLIDFETAERVKKIEEQIAKETDARTKALLEANKKAAVDAGARARTDATLKDQQDRLKAAEDFVIKELDIAFDGRNKSEQAERDKQKAILQVRLEYAKLQLQVLLDAGKKETDEVVKIARQQVRAYEDALEEAGGSGTTNIFEFFGVNEDGLQAFMEDAQAVADVVGIITNSFSQMIQAQIDEKQRQIETYDEQISQLEDLLDKEKDLAAEGMANNVGLLQQEIEDKKALREQEIAERDAAQKRLANIRKAEIAADSVSQISSMITASSNIFKALSPLGPVGVGLAIAAIATMFAAFAAAKVTAFKAAGQTQRFAEGDVIEGRSHAAGGHKYMSVDGSGKLIELEDGEFVTRKTSTQKHLRLLRAINRDDFSGIRPEDPSVQQMFSAMGMLRDSVKDEGVQTHKAVVNSQTVLLHSGIGKAVESYMKDVRNDVKFLADSKRNETKVIYEDEKIRIEQQGQNVRKIIK